MTVAPEAANAKIDDPFAAAFAIASKDDPPAAASAAPAAAASTTAADPAAADTAAAAGGAAAAGEGAGADSTDTSADGSETQPAGEGGTDAEATGGAEGSESEGNDVLARLAQLVKNQPAQATQPEPTQPAAPAQPEVLADIYSDEEKQVLAAYEKDWPDVARAEALKRKNEYRQLVDFVFRSIANELAPIVEVVRVVGERTHLSDLHQAAPDYETLRDGVIEWVKTQPAYLQPAYKHVIQQGTADEVADLVSRYKQATAQPAAATTPKGAAAAKPAASKPDTELPPAAKQAAAALAPVSSKRSAVVAPASPDDFEGAFASFAKELGSS